MIWLDILLLLLKYGPVIFQLVQEILEVIRRRPDKAAALGLELDEAVKVYGRSKDRRPLRRMLERLRAEGL